MTWIRRLTSNNISSSWKSICERFFSRIDLLSCLGPSYGLKCSIESQSIFWIEVFESFVGLHSSTTFKEYEDLYNCPVLFNTNIKMGGNVISDQNLIKGGVFFIKDFMSNGIFLKRETFNHRFNLDLNFLFYKGVTNAIKTFVNKQKNLIHSYKDRTQYWPMRVICSIQKGASHLYLLLIQKDNTKPTGFRKWDHLLEESIDWSKSLTCLRLATSDSKLRWFQLRILHNILTTNKSVSKYKPEQTELCTFCKQNPETIVHIFWERQISKNFISSLFEFISSKTHHAKNLQANKSLILFGTSKDTFTDNILDLIILLSKFFLYRCKVNSKRPALKPFIEEIKQRHDIEKIISTSTGKYEAHRTSWAPYIDIINNK